MLIPFFRTLILRTTKNSGTGYCNITRLRQQKKNLITAVIRFGTVAVRRTLLSRVEIPFILIIWRNSRSLVLTVFLEKRTLSICLTVTERRLVLWQAINTSYFPKQTLGCIVPSRNWKWYSRQALEVRLLYFEEDRIFIRQSFLPRGLRSTWRGWFPE